MEENYVVAIARLEEAVKHQGQLIVEMKNFIETEMRVMRERSHKINEMLQQHEISLSTRACVTHSEDIKDYGNRIKNLEKDRWVFSGIAMAIGAIGSLALSTLHFIRNKQ